MSENPYAAPTPLEPAIPTPGEETVQVVAIPGPGPGAAIMWFLAFVMIEMIIAGLAVMPYIAAGREPDLRLLTHGNVLLNLLLALLRERFVKSASCKLIECSRLSLPLAQKSTSA